MPRRLFSLVSLITFGVTAQGAESLTFTNPFEILVQNNGLPSVDGSTVSDYFLDGGGTVAGDNAHSYDFLRFENMFGSEPGQIPMGATILNASLTMTTALRSNAHTGGAFGVAPLLAPFAASNLYGDYSGPGTGYDGGPSFLNGHVGRPAGGFAGMAGADAQGKKVSADVTLLLQQWSVAPDTAHGFAVSGRTNDGWAPETVGSSNIENRPQLTVEYTTVETKTLRFQQGVNGYVGTTMSSIDQNGEVRNGAFLNAGYLDAPNAAGDSRDLQALIRFDELFGTLDTQIKPDENILRAFLILTTATGGESHSNGFFEVHQMLTEWDLNSNYASFGLDGPTVEQGEITPGLSMASGMIHGSRALFDVTSAVNSWKDDAENFGLNVQSNTTDGWNIHWTGSMDETLRPQLVVITGVPEPSTALLLGGAAVGLFGVRRRRA